MEIRLIFLIWAGGLLSVYIVLNILYSVDLVPFPPWISTPFAGLILCCGLGYFWDNLVLHILLDVAVKPQTVFIALCSLSYFVLTVAYPEEKQVVASDVLWLCGMTFWLCMDAVKFVFSVCYHISTLSLFDWFPLSDTRSSRSTCSSPRCPSIGSSFKHGTGIKMSFGATSRTPCSKGH